MGCEITVVLDDERIATTILNEDGTRAIGTRADPEIVKTVQAGNSYAGRTDILGQTAVAKYTPILGPEDRPIGMIFVGEYIEEETTIIMDFVKSGALITGIMLIVAVALILFVIGRIVRPIHTMTKAATAMAVGDTELDIQAEGNDETRTLADAFNSMIENTRRQVLAVEHIAAGDLTVTLQARSDKDVMNRALEKLKATIKAQAAEIREEHERIRILLDATPLASRLWSKDFRLFACNEAAVRLFGLKTKQEYMERHLEFSPQYQPNGQPTTEKVRELLGEAFAKGTCTYFWTYTLFDGTELPCEVTMVRVPYGDEYVVAAYSRDLREQKKMIAAIEQRDHLLQTVNQAADILLRAEPDDFVNALRRCMDMIARAVEADRMYIWRNQVEDGKLYRTRMYEWSENVLPLQDAPI